jgi:hypothetical protein
MRILPGAIAVLPIFLATPAGATTFLFHVSCESGQPFVAEWDTGSVDPGKEYLRVATGIKFPNCGVSDYDDRRDKNLHRERYSAEGGILQGIPLVGTIWCGIFGC